MAAFRAPRSARESWGAFERRRHLLHPANPFDESALACEKLQDLTAQELIPEVCSSGVKAVLEGRRRAAKPRASPRESPAPASTRPARSEDFRARKKQLFDNVLRSDPDWEVTPLPELVRSSQEEEAALLAKLSSISGKQAAAGGPDEPVSRVLVPRRVSKSRRGSKPVSSASTKGWDVGASLFASFEEVLMRRSFVDKCLEADWRPTALIGLLEEHDMAQVKAILKLHYAEIKMLYSSLCSVDWGIARCAPEDRAHALAFGISLHEYSHMLVQHNLLCGSLSLEDADALFVVSALPAEDAPQKWHRAIQAEGRVLLRHGFVELLLRLALRQSGEPPQQGTQPASKAAEGTSQALERMLHKHFIYPVPPTKNVFRCMQWRAEVLHTEAVDLVYRKHLRDVVTPLFEAYSREGQSPPRSLRPEDWFALLDALEVLPCSGKAGQMNTWDRSWLWQMSAISRVDELISGKHLELLFVEFLEALARLVALLRSRRRAAKASPEESQRWEYGMGTPCATSIFCCDKEGVMDRNAFAEHLDVFLSSEAPKQALALGQRAVS